MKFKFNDKIVVVKDPNNEGFFVGAKGRVVAYMRDFKENPYLIEIEGATQNYWCNEDEIELLK